MKLALRTVHVRSSVALEQEIERRITALNDLYPISAARVLLSRYRDSHPPFCAAVHLAVPGPDLHALAYEHTIAAALLKVERSLREQIALRLSRRPQNLKNRRNVRRVPARGR